jgi:uncharacterized protein YjgD (DUF1641 family)
MNAIVKISVALCLISINLANTYSYADTYENIYVTANIDEHVPEFLAMEIAQDYKESIKDYNSNRKNPRYFLEKIKDQRLEKIFTESSKKFELPEIKMLKNSSFYIIEAGSNRIEFNSTLFLKRKYFFNGVEKTLDSESFVFNDFHSVHNITALLVNSLINSAFADEQDDFKTAYMNLNSTKMLMASLIALDATFKSRSFIDKIPLPLMKDTADINLKNLTKKIESYQAQCENGINSQAGMLKVANTSGDDWSSLGTPERYSMMRALKETSDPDYQNVLGLVRKIASESSDSSQKRDNTLTTHFKTAKKATQCEEMMKPLIHESKSKSNVIAAYIDGGHSADVAFENHPCTQLTKLKMCLSKFATQASNINDFVRRRNADAKEAGVDTYAVPNNYPTENSSK